MKGRIIGFLFFILSFQLEAHKYDHNADLFAQILFPIALLGCLLSIPLSFLVIVSKFDTKLNQMVYGGYSLASLLFFGILRIIYSFVHNHFELTCQVIAVGLYLSLFTMSVYIGKYLYFRVKN